MRLRALSSAALLLLALGGSPSPAHAADLDFGYVPAPGPGEQPALLVTPNKPISTLYVEIEAGGETYRFEESAPAVGRQLRLSWKRDPSVTSASAFVRAIYADGYVDELTIPVEYSYAGQLSVDLSRAAADVDARTLTVQVTAAVERAEITAYGARKAILDQSVVPLSGGPGEVVVPWVGDPGEVVLLDVKLHSASAWSGFTYSPWFLDIPHDDVLFETRLCDPRHRGPQARGDPPRARGRHRQVWRDRPGEALHRGVYGHRRRRGPQPGAQPPARAGDRRARRTAPRPRAGPGAHGSARATMAPTHPGGLAPRSCA